MGSSMLILDHTLFTWDFDFYQNEKNQGELRLHKNEFVTAT